MLSTGAVVGLAGQASATETAEITADLAVKVTGTTIAADASGKFGSFDLTNNGPDTPEAVDLLFDLTDLDMTKVELELPEFCELDGDFVVCTIGSPIPEPGGTADIAIPLVRVDGASGDAGELTFAAFHEGTDPDENNNTVTVAVSVGDHGVDLVVFAEDIYEVTDDHVMTTEPVLPGGESEVLAFVENDGDMTAEGLTVEITLPEHLSFTVPEPECTHEVGDTTTVCEYTGITLVPLDLDESEEDDIFSGIVLFFPVMVADDAPAGVVHGGVVTVNAIEVIDPSQMSISSSADSSSELPDNATEEPPAEFGEVDPTDNTDEFSAFIGELPEGGGGVTLPKTGGDRATFLLAAVGVVAIGAGAALHLLSRRRRDGGGA